MRQKFPIIENAKRQARMVFVGMAIRHQPSLADGVYGPINSEKVLKFNRTALKNMGKVKKEKVDPRYNGGDDTMIIPVGKPGSPERKAALAEQYAAVLASGQEISVFSWKGE
jgi:hypothetical protein